MRLTEKEFIKADGTKIKLTPEWISSKLGEVYELSCLDGNIRKEFKDQVDKYYYKPLFWANSYCIISSGGAPIEIIKKYIEN